MPESTPNDAKDKRRHLVGMDNKAHLLRDEIKPLNEVRCAIIRKEIISLLL